MAQDVVRNTQSKKSEKSYIKSYIFLLGQFFSGVFLLNQNSSTEKNIFKEIHLIIFHALRSSFSMKEIYRKYIWTVLIQKISIKRQNKVKEGTSLTLKHFLSGAENFSCPSSRLSYQYLLSNLQEISLNMGISVETDWG